MAKVELSHRPHITGRRAGSPNNRNDDVSASYPSAAFRKYVPDQATDKLATALDRQAQLQFWRTFFSNPEAARKDTTEITVARALAPSARLISRSARAAWKRCPNPLVPIRNSATIAAKMLLAAARRSATAHSGTAAGIARNHRRRKVEAPRTRKRSSLPGGSARRPADVNTKAGKNEMITTIASTVRIS